jgi:hypothetical protein
VKEYPLRPPVLPGSTDVQEVNPGAFPFEAFNFNSETSDPREIELVAGWRMLNTGGRRAVVSSTSTSPTTITTRDGIEYLLVTTGASAFTVNLPAAASNTGRVITIRKVDSGAGKITVDGSGAETIDGNTTVGIWYQNDYLTLLCDGSGWVIIGAPCMTLGPNGGASWYWSKTSGIVAQTYYTVTYTPGTAFPIGAKRLLVVNSLVDCSTPYWRPHDSGYTYGYQYRMHAEGLTWVQVNSLGEFDIAVYTIGAAPAIYMGYVSGWMMTGRGANV